MTTTKRAPTSYTSPAWTATCVTFRDALRADPALLREYQALKQNLSSALDLAEYTRGKRGFVATVLKAAGVDLA